MKLSLSRHSRCAARRIPWIDRRATVMLRETAAALGREEDTVEIVIVDDDYIRQINREYRGLDNATDVISFSYLDGGVSPAPADDVAGEIYVSHETLERDAIAQGVPAEYLFLRLVVHGLLHLLGYDHRTDADARRMETEEKRLLLDHLNPAEVEELF
ncbi:MAG: rRNA maturation RNase YbeY [Candidatus Latescibacterota bacterium]|nr:MAG: rRNA maturation RNase YbeY [Candidatus Latescibacterota bacterium]